MDDRIDEIQIEVSAWDKEDIETLIGNLEMVVEGIEADEARAGDEA